MTDQAGRIALKHKRERDALQDKLNDIEDTL